MRLVLVWISLLIALAVVGLLAKKYMGDVTAAQDPAITRNTITESAGLSDVKNSVLQSQQIKDHVRQSLEAAFKISRTSDEE
ncbi:MULTISPECIES: hypothetical protein [unclassified Polaromonas]|uniref:hypothetical protein n=1 Tax=unclassified Polaromonas TaxID=2638319 RepID=UPI0018CBAC60|nr:MULTISPECIES: hypothetical protein [unclassified Polaromonas]MBG6073635.1 hypothetical protein [Polaromonas sp. CG_9.7]MBG6115586.1 hypothetical protein [Polaromonas sp. CG_9.2]MDH6185039.1 hypothetical protein [Polaromonas sp. CG_23.6]